MGWKWDYEKKEWLYRGRSLLDTERRANAPLGGDFLGSVALFIALIIIPLVLYVFL